MLQNLFKFEEIGFIDANIFIPIIRIHDGIPVNPSRIYVHREKKNLDIFFKNPENNSDSGNTEE